MKHNVSSAVTGTVGLLILLVLLFPLICTAALSVFSPTDLGFYYFHGNTIDSLKLIPDNFTLAQYAQALLYNTDYTRAFTNSVLYTTLTVLLAAITALPAAYALVFCRLRSRKIIFVLLFTIMVLPIQAVEIPQWLMMRKWGLLGSDASIILTGVIEPFDVLVLTIFFSAVPRETLEAAAVDGAGIIRTMVRIVFPQAMHGIVLMFLLKFIQIWNMTEQPVLFLDDTTHQPLSVMLSALCEANTASAFGFSMVFLLPPLLLYGVFGDRTQHAIPYSIQK